MLQERGFRKFYKTTVNLNIKGYLSALVCILLSFVGQLVWFEFIALKFYRPKRALGLGDQMAW